MCHWTVLRLGRWGMREVWRWVQMRSRRSWQGGGPRVGVRGRDQQDLTGQRVTRQLIMPAGLVNNSVLYVRVFFSIMHSGKNVCFRDAPSKFASDVFESVPGPPSLGL